MNILSKLVSPGKIRAFSWLGGISSAISIGTVVWLIRPLPEVTESTGLLVFVWIIGTLMWTWAVGAVKWNELLNQVCSPHITKENLQIAIHNAEVAINKSIRFARNASLALMSIGAFIVATEWNDQYRERCSADAEGNVHCSNLVATGSGFLVTGIMALFVWFFISQRQSEYLQYVKPLLLQTNEHKNETE